MTTTRAALHLLTLRWTDLANTLGTPAAHAWYGVGIRAHLAAATEPDERDALQAAAALRALERSPEQIGARPIPLRLDIYEAMREITVDMRQCADVVASRAQLAPMAAAPHGLVLSPTKAARRRQRAAEDAADPRRWPIGTTVRGLESAVNWLTARVTDQPGPFRLLDVDDHHVIRNATRTAIWRAEQALDRGVDTALALAQPCPRCGGQVTMQGMRASCGGCRASWSAAPAAA
ncbi:hypothetical protein [Streptomyces sp. NPDC023838]|uniref:hypothetical protein n=1 Tax=Streptomyces sp. NPDC023838 TaxID=3154325 RepID=UPI0033DBEF48